MAEFLVSIFFRPAVTVLQAGGDYQRYVDQYAGDYEKYVGGGGSAGGAGYQKYYQKHLVAKSRIILS